LDEIRKIIYKTKVFELDFIETAISKTLKEKLEKVFLTAKYEGKKVKINVNSVITE
jgi:hypothetical protein